MSVKQSLGKVSITPKGAWDNSIEYVFLDIVTNDGESYLARKVVPIGTPLSDTSYWMQITEKGGKGDKGDPFTYADMTDAEKDDIASHVGDDVVGRAEGYASESKAAVNITTSYMEMAKNVCEIIAGNYFEISINDTRAYQKVVPQGAMGKVFVNMVGGYTHYERGDFGGSYYHGKVDKIQSFGLNLWDEQWENGMYSTSTGKKWSSEDKVCTKNELKVLPDTDYYFTAPTNSQLVGISFDKDRNIIKPHWNAQNKVLHTPSNCRYLGFYEAADYGASYNHDICFNLSGRLNGTYKPYNSYTWAMPNALWSYLSDKAYGQADDGNYSTHYNYIDFIRKVYVQVGEYKNLGQGVLSWRTFETPKEYDISSYLTAMPILPIEEGGVIIFEQRSDYSHEYMYPVPSNEAFLLQK